MRDIKRLLEEDIKLQEKLIRRYKQELRNMPTGYLTVRKRKGGCAYFVNTGVSGAKGKERRQRYLKQSEGKKVWQLQMKRLMQEAVKRMERNVEREKKWAALYQPYDFLSVQKDMREAYQNLSAEQLQRGQYFFSADLLGLAAGSREVLEGTKDAAHGAKSRQFYAEGRTQRTMSGILVRSKSEVILADTLTMLEIPFLYEAAA